MQFNQLTSVISYNLIDLRNLCYCFGTFASFLISITSEAGSGLEISYLKQVKTWDFVAENGIRSL